MAAAVHRIIDLQSGVVMTFLRKLFRGDSQPSDSKAVLPTEAPSAAPIEPERPEEAPAAPDQTAAPANDEEHAWWEEPAQTIAPPSDSQLASPEHEADPPPPNREADPPDQAAQIDAVVADDEPVVPADADALPRAVLPSSIEEDSTRPLTAADTPALVALRSRQGFAAAGLRDIGRVRSVNQDSLYVLTTTLPRESNDVTIGLFVVADGMGGHAGGEVASRLAISTIARYVLAELVIPALTDGGTEALQPLIIAAVQEANRAIWEHAQVIGSDMGTTCTVALLLGQALYMGHVGDSRAYLVTPTGMRLISTDHSTVGRLIQLGQLDPAEAREHPLRSQLYRTVGQHPDVLVDFIYQPIGDATHLLICSDGLWSMLDEEVLLDVLEHTLWPQDACRELIARANLAGGEDNITALVVTLPTLSSQQAGARSQH
jgi:serine/threonine protein phosphatase PrpC